MTQGATTEVDRVSPLRDPSRRARMVKVVSWIGGLAVLMIVLDLVGLNVLGWLDQLWTQITSIPVQYLVAGVALEVVHTTLSGVAYYGILSYGYPDAGVTLWPIVTAYAVGVAMNGFLPANLGSFVMLLMFLAIVPGATFPGVLAAFLVNKIFFTVMGTLVYVYLFVSAGEAFDTELGWIRDHGVLLLLLLVGAAALVVVLVRVFWRRLKGLWAQAKQGGKILESPRAYATRVLLPQILSYAAKIGVIAVFLAAYSIPVTFNSVTHVMGSTSAATVTTVTPGGVGVTQAANAVALRDYTDPATATAYSLTQELVTTATNVVLALILVLLVFGWTGGKGLVEESYTGAKEKVRTTREASKEKRRRRRNHPEG